MFIQTVTNSDVVSTEGWLVANINMTGFYRVNYDAANWERLLAGLNSAPQVGKMGMGWDDATRSVSGRPIPLNFSPSSNSVRFSGYSSDQPSTNYR